jgi:predicted acetyltransferase
MSIEIIPALITDKSLIQRMMELFRHDLSEFEDIDLNEHGYFGYPYLDYYWVEPERYPFIVRVDRKLAGFVLVNQHTHFPNSQYSVAEFFILRKYRRRGIGRQIAFDLFDRFPGRWEISKLQTNVTALRFWREVIDSYLPENYTETVLEIQDCQRVISCFDNSIEIKSGKANS